VSLSSCILLAAGLFCVGTYGLLSRRQAVAMLLSIELMANAANLSFVAFAHFRGGAAGPLFALFALALTVAEVAVGLALVLLLYRRYGHTRPDEAKELRG
jgi:NADH-quinone oxidoreductase subunit K